jgi:CHAT domain-containing protein/Tfp pilus assembly protein PilF
MMNKFRKMLLSFLLVILWVPVGAEDLSTKQQELLTHEKSQLDIYQVEGQLALEKSNYSVALDKWNKGLQKALKLNSKYHIGEFYGNLCTLYNYIEQDQKALEYCQQALNIAREIDNQFAIGMNLNNIGLIYDDLGKYQQALDYYLQAFAISRKIKDREKEGQTLANIGTVYAQLGQYQQALEYFQKALKIGPNYDKLNQSICLGNIGVIYFMLGEYQQALKYYQQGLTVSRDINSVNEDLNRENHISDFLKNIAVVHHNLGQYQEAIELYQQALALDRKSGNKRGEADNMSLIAVTYQTLGKYKLALDYYQQGLETSRQVSDQRVEANTLLNLGVLYGKLGQYQLALKSLQQALLIHRRIGYRWGESYDLTSIGAVYELKTEYQQALRHYQQALAIHHELGDQYGEARDLTSIGVVYIKQGKDDDALSKFQKALVIHRKIGDKHGQGYDLENLGLFYLKLDQYQKAHTAFKNAVDILKKLDADILWRVQYGLASVNTHLNKPDSAIIYYEQAIANIENLRVGLTEKEHKISLMRDKLYVYDEFMTLLQGLGYDRQAIEIFERKQGRIFLEEMGQSGARLFAGLPEEILQGQFDLENQLTKTRENLVNERSKPIAGLKGEVVQNKQLIKNLEQDEQKLQTQLEELQQTIKTKYPDYYALKYPKPVKLDTLQKQVLQSDELMLIYGVMENSTTLWVIGKNTFEMFDLPLSESKLTKKISDIRDWMGTGDKTRGFNVTDRKYGEIKVKLNQASHELYAQLIPEKVRNLLTKERTVYVIPTGPLYALPFETLVTQVSKDFKEAHYLIENVPIAYLSSASLLKILRDAQKRRQNTAKYPLLAFANPIYEATSSSTQLDIIDKLRDEAYRNLKNGFAPLPETEDEAKEIAKLLKAPTDTNALQLGEAASVPTVNKFNDKTRLDDYQYVLFSTHGILPGEIDQIKQPALVLSYPEKWGYLKMADVFGLKLNAKLVALSACNTGNGKNEKGEGVMGLTRAFMYAGTPAIAVTLWSVESFSAKTLNVGFFKELKNNEKPAAALRAIKLRMLRGDEGEKYKRPYYWAPFVVFGDAK